MTTNDKYSREVIDPGDRASKFAKEICFESHHNNPAVRIIAHQPGNFRGPVGFVWNHQILYKMAMYSMDNHGNVIDWHIAEEVEDDGAGGKPQFFTLVGTEEVLGDLGWEIIVMTADDFARSGRFSAVISNEANFKGLTDKNFHLFEAMMRGYGRALKSAHLVNITGETAVMKNSITAFCDANSDEQFVLTWGASCIGLARKALLIDGSGIKPDQPIVGF